MSADRSIVFTERDKYEHFKNIAEWKHPSNKLEADDSAMTLTFSGNIDRIVEAQGRQLGGVWK